MKKIVVFGASGDTGQYFVRHFLDNYTGNEYQIVATGTRETDCFDQLGVSYYRVDITNKDDFSKLPKDVYAVVDLAGAMPARMKGYNPYKYIDVNIIGNLNILEYCRTNHVDRILFAQSFGDIKDYGEENPLLTVDLPRKFSFTSDHTIYVMSKNFAVDMIENYHQMYGLKRFIFRLPTIYLYSPVDTFYVDGVQRKIGYRLLIDKARAGEPIEVWGDSSRVKDMVYVKDFCQMLYKALFVDKSCGYYNVGTGVGTSLLDQIKGMVEIFGENGRKSEIIMRPDKPNAPQYIMDITPAVKDLGYEPKYNYLEMLRDFKQEMLLAESI
ncbi:NAD(P)-dependent oxidoreductase [Blautia sp. AM16-16B]|nr:NAD(P)-dependent oxidoreductase [Blautia sp. AM16-16B]RHS47898.1 NAD(P)-dependent oxidoreductase [Blautia sp. AM46-5]